MYIVFESDWWPHRSFIHWLDIPPEFIDARLHSGLGSASSRLTKSSHSNGSASRRCCWRCCDCSSRSWAVGSCTCCRECSNWWSWHVRCLFSCRSCKTDNCSCKFWDLSWWFSCPNLLQVRLVEDSLHLYFKECINPLHSLFEPCDQLLYAREALLVRSRHFWNWEELAAISKIQRTVARSLIITRGSYPRYYFCLGICIILTKVDPIER